MMINNKSDKQTNLIVNTGISSASSLHTGSHVTAVYLNLYDLGGCINACIHSIGLSFYHCAVQAHSAEYGYMGHPYKFTGLYKTSKHDARFHLYRLRHSIEVGWTWFSEKEIDQIINDLKSFYLGFDYDTIKKNSIHFAKYLLEQLSNDPQLKHIEPIKIIQFPSYIDRSRRLSNTFQFLQIFDREKDIAEINILYFLYMKYEGNIKEICQILKCDTIDKLKRYIELIEQGIQEKKLPIFSSFISFDMIRSDNYLYINNENKKDILSDNQHLTLTDIFHQFDTITLRGRTSIDRYLNIQQSIQNQQQLDRIEGNNIKYNQQPIHHSSLPQNISQNQGETPLISPSQSNISGLAIKSTTPILIDPFLKFEQLHMRTAVPIGTVLRLQDKSNPELPLSELHLTKTDDHNSLSLVSNQQLKHFYSSRKRKFPRDLELNTNLYKIINPNSLHHNYTNNAISTVCSFDQSSTNILSFQKNKKIFQNIDSNV